MGAFKDFLNKVREAALGALREPDDTVRHTAVEREESARRQAVDQARQESREQERAEAAWEMREDEGIAKAERKLQEELIKEATADIRQVMENGRPNGVPFAQLERDAKLELLDWGIEWGDFIRRGMDRETPSLLMSNAVDGKPPERWLEPRPEPVTPPKDAGRSEFDRRIDEAAKQRPQGRPMEMDR